MAMNEPEPGSARAPSPLASLALVCVCVMLGAISALETRHVSIVHGQPLAWSLVLQTTTPRWILLAAALPFVLHLATRVPLVPVRGRVVVMHVAAFFVLSWTQAAADAWATGRLSPDVIFLFAWSARVTRAWYNTMPTMVSMYVAVLVAAWGIGEARERERRTLRASQLEAQLQSARLASLRAQLQPHFLYNTLTGIAALVADVQPARAVAAIEQLGELLHASLRDDGREEITVAEEVALAEQYLALQGMRFGERLRYARDIAPDAAACMVPVLLLQPIVENAVLHGLDTGEGTVAVTIRAVTRGNDVELSVENDGSTLDAVRGRTTGHGVGLAATRARLATAFGDRASLTLAPRDGGGVMVRIALPRVLSAVSTNTERRRGPDRVRPESILAPVEVA